MIKIMPAATKKKTMSMKQHMEEAQLLADERICAVCWHHALAPFLNWTDQKSLYCTAHDCRCDFVVIDDSKFHDGTSTVSP